MTLLGRTWRLVTGKTYRLRWWVAQSPEHPFFEYNQGWLAAGALKVGDRIREKYGWVVVDDLLDTGEFATVYNLRVADWHTYFVGAEEWGLNVWAHNAGYGNAYSSAKLATLYQLVDRTTGALIKWGISNNPARRYSQKYLASINATLNPIMTGVRSRIAPLERSLTSQLPGPKNYEPWAGSMFPR
jgi:hypothetical protein